MTDLEPLNPQQVSINMDPRPSRSKQLSRGSKAAVTDLVYFVAPTTELAIKMDAAGGRLVKRSSGRSLIQHINLPPQYRVGFFRDFFTTIVNSRWYCLIVFFSSLYVASWLVFGSVWLGLNTALDSGGGGNVTCVTDVIDFPSALLFSIETQMTIGYGFKYITNECRTAIVIIIVQCVCGLLIDSFLLGLIFTKLSRPRNRRRTLLFSDYSVIRDGEGARGRVLEFRIADVRRSQVVEAHVRLQLYWYRESAGGGGGGELQQYDLEVGYDEGRDRIFLLTPVSVFHYITEQSPLYGLTREDLASSRLELVVILEGIVEVTGLTSQALWSYTSDEILFDRRFVSTISHRHGRWQVDFSKLSLTSPHCQHQPQERDDEDHTHPNGETADL
jgi:hypothetical protein